MPHLTQFTKDIEKKCFLPSAMDEISDYYLVLSSDNKHREAEMLSDTFPGSEHPFIHIHIRVKANPNIFFVGHF